jgi:hypothetical protein
MSLPIPTRRAVWACPRNGEPTDCQTCHRQAPHRVEWFAWDAPRCETHDVPMIPAPEERP